MKIDYFYGIFFTIMKQQTLLYIKLSGKSYRRLFREFPIVLQGLFLLLLGGMLFFLAETAFVGSFTNYAIVFILFVLINRWLCRISAPERVLLSLLRISVIQIKAMRCILLSLPFFLLDLTVGVLLLTVGTPAVVFLPEKVIRNRALPSFYAPASYQWLGMYRQSGVWTLSAGFLLLLIGLWHHNTHMVYFFLGWIMLMPCFLTYYNADPSQFLAVYKSPGFLMWKKVCELLFNSTMPAVVALMLVLIFDFSHAVLYLKFAFLFVYVALLLFYGRYIGYPHTLTALVLSAILIFASVLSFTLFPLATAVACLLLLPVLHMLAVYNLKTFLAHGKN